MEKVIPHKHNGVDAERIEYTDLSILPEEEVASPTGGVTQDAEARTAIDGILAILQAKGFMK